MNENETSHWSNIRCNLWVNSACNSTTTALIDPNGPIPAWLLNQLSVGQPFAVVTRLRELTAVKPAHQMRGKPVASRCCASLRQTAHEGDRESGCAHFLQTYDQVRDAHVAIDQVTGYAGCTNGGECYTQQQ